MFDFLKAAGNQYDEEGRSREFVCDLLDLKVPQLFVVTNDHMKGQIIDLEETISAVQSVQQKFSFFLNDYIINKALKNCLLGKIDKIMVGAKLSCCVYAWCRLIMFLSSRTLHSAMMTIFNN